MRYAKLRKGFHYRAQVRFLFRRVETRHFQNTAAGEMDSAHIVEVQTDIVLLSASQTGKSVIHAQNIPSTTICLIRNSGNNRIDAGCRAAAADNSNYILDSDHSKSSFCLEHHNLIYFLLFYLPKKNPPTNDKINLSYASCFGNSVPYGKRLCDSRICSKALPSFPALLSSPAMSAP